MSNPTASVRPALLLLVLPLGLHGSAGLAQSIDPIQQVIDLTNAERTRAGLPPLRSAVELNAAAADHADWMTRNACFDHQCAAEPDLQQRVRARGYLAGAGENIGKG